MRVHCLIRLVLLAALVVGGSAALAQESTFYGPHGEYSGYSFPNPNGHVLYFGPSSQTAGRLPPASYGVYRYPLGGALPGLVPLRQAQPFYTSPYHSRLSPLVPSFNRLEYRPPR
jgi:streptogramin lyase